MPRDLMALTTTERIKSVINIAQFLNPVKETVDDFDDDVIDAIVEIYNTGAERGYETDEDDVSEPLVKGFEALQLLKRLRLYEKQQKDDDDVLITRLNRYKREIRARGASKQQQTSIVEYFT